MAKKQTKSNSTVVKPRAPHSGFGFARSKDVHDKVNQQRAPSGPRKRYDRTGDQEYAEGVKSFEEDGGSVPRSDHRKSPPD